MTVRAVSVELRPCGEGHALIVLFHNIAAFDGSDESAHVLVIGSRLLFFNRALDFWGQRKMSDTLISDTREDWDKAKALAELSRCHDATACQ